MKKIFKFLTFCLAIYILYWFGSVLADRKILTEDVIRLHVVADSDSEEDQQRKIMVRDAIIEELQGAMDEMPTAEEAKQWLKGNLENLKGLARRVLHEAGCDDTVEVSLVQEAFDTRHYDTFSLPAGLYDALRITIGRGEGKNWWCVVFPTLCLDAAGEEELSAGSGFGEALSGTIEGEKKYRVRFFVLDLLGRIQNLICRN